jgi:hypothetical protein
MHHVFAFDSLECFRSFGAFQRDEGGSCWERRRVQVAFVVQVQDDGRRVGGSVGREELDEGHRVEVFDDHGVAFELPQCMACHICQWDLESPFAMLYGFKFCDRKVATFPHCPQQRCEVARRRLDSICVFFYQVPERKSSGYRIVVACLANFRSKTCPEAPATSDPCGDLIYFNTSVSTFITNSPWSGDDKGCASDCG